MERVLLEGEEVAARAWERTSVLVAPRPVAPPRTRTAKKKEPSAMVQLWLMLAQMSLAVAAVLAAIRFRPEENERAR